MARLLPSGERGDGKNPRPALASGKDWSKIKLAFYDRLVVDPALTAADKAVAWKLLNYINREDGNPRRGTAWPSLDRLADDTECSRRTIIRSGKRLAARGWFAVRKGGGRTRSNTYVPVWKKISDETVPAASPNGVEDDETVTRRTGNGDRPVVKRVTPLSPDPSYRTFNEDPSESARFASRDGSRSARASTDGTSLEAAQLLASEGCSPGMESRGNISARCARPRTEAERDEGDVRDFAKRMKVTPELARMYLERVGHLGRTFGSAAVVAAGARLNHEVVPHYPNPEGEPCVVAMMSVVDDEIARRVTAKRGSSL